jgi:predicted transcriptional regulator with HTH domain
MLYLSESESEIFGVNVARNSNYMEGIELENANTEMMNLHADVVRIKVNGAYEPIFKKLNQLNLPYELYTINYFNKSKIGEAVNFDKLDFSILNVENPRNHQGFMDLLNDVLESKSWFEYESELSNHILPFEKRKQLATRYYSSFSESTQKNAYSAILLKAQEPIGIFIGYFVNETYNGVLYGISSKYRTMGYAKYPYLFMMEECRKRGIKYFQNDVSIFNMVSQKATISQNLLPENIFFNITIYPYFNYLAKSSKKIKLRLYNLQGLLEYINLNFPDLSISSIKCRNYDVLNDAIPEVYILTPAQTNSYCFFVAHFIVSAKIVESYYIETKNQLFL